MCGCTRWWWDSRCSQTDREKGRPVRDTGNSIQSIKFCQSGNSKFYINDTLQSTESVDQSEHIWSYRTTDAGTLKLAIECDGKRWEKTIEVSALSSDISEITDSLVLKIDPNKITDLKIVSGLTLSENFDTHNGGLQTDPEGIRCIKVVKGDRITLDYKLFGTDARKDGRNFKFIYKVENSSLFDAQAITCMNNNIGLNMKANSMTVKTEQTTLEYPLCEGYKTEAEVNIEPIQKIAW